MHNADFETSLKIGVVLLHPSNAACGFITLSFMFSRMFSIFFALVCVLFLSRLSVFGLLLSLSFLSFSLLFCVLGAEVP